MFTSFLYFSSTVRVFKLVLQWQNFRVSPRDTDIKCVYKCYKQILYLTPLYVTSQRADFRDHFHVMKGIINFKPMSPLVQRQSHLRTRDHGQSCGVLEKKTQSVSNIHLYSVVLNGNMQIPLPHCNTVSPSVSMSFSVYSFPHLSICLFVYRFYPNVGL